MTALLPLAVILALSLSLSSRVSAQTGVGGATGTSALTSDDFSIRVESEPGVTLRDFDLLRFFNIANCQCDVDVSIFFTLSASGFLKRSQIPTGTVQFFVGYLCDQIGVAGRNCVQLGDQGGIPLSTFAAAGGQRITTKASILSTNRGQAQVGVVTDAAVTTDMDGGTTGDVCQVGTEFDQNLYIAVTLTGTSTLAPVLTVPIHVDLRPPIPQPEVSVAPGNEALVVSWTPIDTSAIPDFLGYQVLCDRGGALQVFSNGTFSAGFRTCPKTLPAGTDNDTQVLATNPNYVCSPMLSRTTTSFRVKILENDIVYGVGVAAIDTHYNPSQPLIKYQAPTKTLSFYEKYRNGDSMSEPGRANGGLCAVADDFGDHRTRGAELAVLAGTVALGLVTLRRRRRGGKRGES